MKKRFFTVAASGLFILVLIGAANASLLPAGIWTGNVGISIDAVGSNADPVGNIQASIVPGATIEAAYLYTAGTPYPWYSGSPTTLADYNNAGITLAGNTVTSYDTIIGSTSDRPEVGRWYTARADVTDLITSLATTGPNYSWEVTESSAFNNYIDGSVLAVIYSDASLPEGSVAIIDGGQSTGGETSRVSFAAPADPTDPGFFADMSLGISFSFADFQQSSTIDINGTRLTSSAGDFNDGIGWDGGLITAGGIGDTNSNPSDPYATDKSLDDELYSLIPFLSIGDMGFNIYSFNSSADDNLFFMALHTSATISGITPDPNPEPGTMLLFGTGLAGAAGAARRRKRHRE